MADEVGQAFVSIVPSLKGFSAKLKADMRRELGTVDPVVAEAGDKAGKTFGSRMGDSLKSGMGRIGQILKTGLVIGGAATAAGLAALTGFGLKSAAALEQTTVGIEALLGSAEDAKVFLGELQEFAKTTPFEFSGVADASRRILAFGKSVGIARDEVIPTLTTIGDLVAVLGGTQENVDSVVRALGQMASKGKLSQEEILQLAEALPGFNANAAIAAELGVPVSEALEMITKGEVDATTGINALLKGMGQFPGAAGAMEKQAQTLSGVFAAFKDTIGLALTNAFTPVIPAIKQAMADVTPILGDAIDQIAPALGGLLTSLLPMIGAVAQGLAPVIGPILDAISGVLTEITPVIAPLGEAFGELFAALGPLLPVLAKVVVEIVKALMPAILKLAPVVDKLVPPLIAVLEALLPILPVLTDLLVLALDIIGPMIALASAWASFLAAKFLAPMIKDISKAIAEILKPLRWVVDLFGGFVDWLIGVDWAGVGDAITKPFRDAWNWIAGVWAGITGWFTGLRDDIAAAWGLVKDILAAPFVAAWEVIKGILNAMIDGINVVIDGLNLINPFNDIPHIPGIGRSKTVGPTKQGTGKAIGPSVGNRPGTSRGGPVAMAHGGVVGASPGGSIVRVAEAGRPEVIAPVDEIYDAIRSGVAYAATAAPAPQRVEIASSDPLILMLVGQLKEQIRTRFGGDVDLALGTV